MRKILSEQIKEKIRNWDKDDIYAISLYVQDYCDNPCEPTVTLGYNTNANFKTSMETCDVDEKEAKWNYAFWLQNQELVFGENETQEIVKKWIEKIGYRYYSYDEMFHSDIEPDEESYDGITEAFLKELIAIVQDLHASGFIQEQFGRPIPVIIHELEYYDEIAEQNLEANPKELIEDFIEFCTE